MANLENENKSINNLSKDAVDGKELKGGGGPGFVDPMDIGDAGWLDPNDPMGGIHHPPVAGGQDPNFVSPVDPVPGGHVPGGPLDGGPIGEILPPTVV